MGWEDVIRNLVRNTGNKLVTVSSNDLPSKMDSDFGIIYHRSKDYTMTCEQKMYSLYTAIKYVVNSKIPGDIVECGVWKGGSSMLAALTLLAVENREKWIYLYDTYAGMSEPTSYDVDFEGRDTREKWIRDEKDDFNTWCYSSLEEVKQNMLSTRYPPDKLKFVRGKVEETIPHVMPENISLLRLDTDWYESTYHELDHLFPLLSPNGVLIIDDYGYWEGCRKAVDEYLEENNINLLLNPIDSGGAIAIKTSNLEFK